MRLLIPMLAAAAVLTSATATLAEKLPKSATKLSSTELTAVYSGKSSSWSKARAYFAPNGEYKIVSKKNTFYGEGKWSVSGNKICAKFKWVSIKKGTSGNGTDCWTWYKDGKRLLTSYSGNKDKNSVYEGEAKKLKKGDKVSKKLSKLKNKS